MRFLRNKRQCVFALSIIAFLILWAFLYIHQVSTQITSEDRIYISKILSGHAYSSGLEDKSFEKQIEIIRAVQNAVLDIAPKQERIPTGQEREPKDLYLGRQGECFDRSRTLEKIYFSLGFQVRYTSLYLVENTKSTIGTLFTKAGGNVISHALVEVKTNKGWLFVDSNNRFISLDAQGNPVNLEQWKDYVDTHSDSVVFQWDTANKDHIYFLMNRPFIYVYGLYSRNGRFYPPYNFIPDVNWAGLLANF